MNDDWDLQAVVRGCSTSTMEDPLSRFAPLSVQQDHSLFYFPDLFESFETRTVLEELDDLYKPFLPKLQPLSSVSALGGLKDKQQHDQQKQEQQPQRSLAGSARAASTAHSQTPRSKRRRNQQKKVVCQVPAEGISSDMWAWRKYGQKPIKGSPYPRGYYRCSSSKGCLARKQVERSRSDPTMYIITYTAEHNHPLPTHRNSLAGSTRQKFSTSQQATTGDPDTPTNKPSCVSSPISTTDLSPIITSIEDDLLLQTNQESREDEEMVEEDDILIPNMETTDELFMAFGELAGPISTDLDLDGYFFEQFPGDFFPSFVRQ
ncbi:hypothetical protein HHK36_026038 [Tetracentron sinense]|uniref:WRKY domain-containing protein n=1 Tax=Tetracentron sinense TaxID=13715 RepID=A0A835D6Z4_TETSI|nr:hypothetical protein HHK36_026038 [Tetracentron sinense]